MSEHDDGIRQGGDDMAWVLIVVMWCMGITTTLGFAAAPAWYLTLKMAVTLSHDDVVEVINKATLASLSDDDAWAKLVAQPALALGKGTMRHLSAGWGTGVFALGCPVLLLFWV